MKKLSKTSGTENSLSTIGNKLFISHAFFLIYSGTFWKFGGRPTWVPLQLFNFDSMGFGHFLRVFFRQGYGQDTVFKGCLDTIFLDVADRELTAESMAAAFFADIFLLIVFFIFLFFSDGEEPSSRLYFIRYR